MVYMVLDHTKGVTKISRIKDYWYIIIPKVVQEQLKKLGVDYGHLVVWHSIEEKEGVVEVVLRIVKTTRVEVSRPKVVKIGNES